MTRYLLDTNVISESRKPRPHKGVLQWFSNVTTNDMLVSAVTIGEIQKGIEITRERDLEKALEIESWLETLVDSMHIVAMDDEMFRECARLMHRRSRADLEDTMIAATARVRSLVVATRNVDDFRLIGVDVFNPFTYRG